jgi:protein-S-isoprenylcysteine O-methyltransferase Ste14
MELESSFYWAFLLLLVGLLTMRVYFMVKVRRSGGRLTPDMDAVRREGGKGFILIRVVAFIALLAFLGMFIARMAWIQGLSFYLPFWMRWIGFAIGILSLAFMTWTQATLDTQWSAQLQLRENHHLITSGPYARIRHPLYTSTLGWGLALSLLTANWIFVGVSVIAIIGLILRVPKEEQMMMDKFGDEYKSYMLRTGRYFPKY